MFIVSCWNYVHTVHTVIRTLIVFAHKFYMVWIFLAKINCLYMNLLFCEAKLALRLDIKQSKLTRFVLTGCSSSAKTSFRNPSVLNGLLITLGELWACKKGGQYSLLVLIQMFCAIKQTSIVLNLCASSFWNNIRSGILFSQIFLIICNLYPSLSLQGKCHTNDELDY